MRNLEFPKEKTTLSDRLIGLHLYSNRLQSLIQIIGNFVESSGGGIISMLLV